VINVVASVDNNVANSEEVLADVRKTILKELVSDYPGLSYRMEGEEKERVESMQSMMKGFALSLMAIYALLAIPFRSYIQPFIIMTAIPFGLVGAILGHLFMGYDLSILSIFGIVALSGVVVNDSLLLIDYMNQKRKQGAGVHDAAVLACTRRFRPVLLTSLTTYFGLAPMIFEKSLQAQFLIPMALSLGYGVLVATFITLVLIPCLYIITDDMKRLTRALIGR
jgi:multidrug efflux pump subunit AcrB